MSTIEQLRDLYLQNTSEPDEHKLQLLSDVEFAMNRELDVSELPYIIVLGASMDKKRGIWKLPNIVKSDNNFLVGGRTRAFAAGQLVNEGFKGKFLVTGGTQKDSDQYVSRAHVLAQHMIQRYEVPQEQIEVIGTYGNGNTLGNINNTIEYFEEVGIPIGQPVGLLTNMWHLDRSLLMFLSNPYFDNYDINLFPLSADDILKRIGNKHLNRWIELFNNNPCMDQRQSMEIKGGIDFLAGDYKPLSQ